MRRKKVTDRPAALTCQTSIKVRFSEVDSMKIVWHGNYVHYFEDGREAFGRTFPGIGYMDIYESGYTAPIVDVHVQFIRPLTINDEVEIETRYIDLPGAKMCFDYVLRRVATGEEVARGTTMQVFLDPEGEMCLTMPPFYENWKKRWIV